MLGWCAVWPVVECAAVGREFQAMRITTRFNVAMTFAVFALVLLVHPEQSMRTRFFVIETLFPEIGWPRVTAMFVLMVLRFVVPMYLIRTIWNRLLPWLCGWREIRLAEAYALSLMASLL